VAALKSAASFIRGIARFFWKGRKMSSKSGTISERRPTSGLDQRWRNAAQDVLLDLYTAKTRLKSVTPDTFDDDAPELDRLLGGTYNEVQSLTRAARAMCPPRYERFDLRVELQRWSPTKVRPMSDGALDSGHPWVVGDLSHCLACLELIRNGVDLEADGGLRMDLFTDDAMPTLMAHAVRGARFHDTLRVTESFRVEWDVMRHWWAAATNGGAMSWPTAKSIALPFRGSELTPSGQPAFEDVLRKMERAAAALLPWRGAYGAAGAYIAPAEGCRLYRKHTRDAIAAIEKASAAIEPNVGITN
jgi:hypothetical protein